MRCCSRSAACCALFDALEGPHGLFLNEPATRAFEAFRARLHEERRQADGIEAAWLGKGGGAVACVAGVFALMSWAASNAKDMPRFVGPDSVENAVSLWRDYYRPHALALFRQSGTTEESQARRAVRWLRSSGREVISREDVRRTALGQAVDARETDQVIACLVDGGVLRLRPLVPTGRAGRPALRWDVNPLLLKQAEESSLGARHSSGAIFSCLDDDARLESRAPSSANCANGANREMH
jgi:hypothetical protein